MGISAYLCATIDDTYPLTLMIRLDHLSIGYRTKHGAKTVAAGIQAEIRSGELTCLLGANGVGKSTLLRTLSSFQPKLDGHIYIRNKEVDEYTDKELARLIGVVLTERPQVQNLSVEDLIGLGRSPYTGFWGTLDKADKDIVRQSARLVGVEHLLRRMSDTLSDGERQKVMIAKALAQETPIILLDEPTAFLDFPSKVEIMQLLQGLSRQTGKTIFLSTHDLDLALQLADRVWLMQAGGRLDVGVPEDLALDGTLSRFFVRKGIGFDADSGLFRVEHECTRRIRLSGKGARATMIKKALRRNGIEAGNEALSDTCIEVREECYCLARAGRPLQTAKSVEELLRLLLTSSS